MVHRKLVFLALMRKGPKGNWILGNNERARFRAWFSTWVFWLVYLLLFCFSFVLVACLITPIIIALQYTKHTYTLAHLVKDHFHMPVLSSGTSFSMTAGPHNQKHHSSKTLQGKTHLFSFCPFDGRHWPSAAKRPQNILVVAMQFSNKDSSVAWA